MVKEGCQETEVPGSILGGYKFSFFFNLVEKNSSTVAKMASTIYEREMRGDAMFVSFWGTQTWRP